MVGTSQFRDRFDGWFSIRQPVSYWSFWGDLLRVVPVLAGLFVLVAFSVGTQFAVLSFAPLPFVFVAATVGFAIRELNLMGGFWSLVLSVSYGFVLAVTDVGWLLLRRPTPILTAVAVLSFISLIVGFAAPALHGQRGDREFEAAYHRHQVEDDEE